MMRITTLLLSIFAILASACGTSLEAEFAVFKQKYNKEYRSEDEELYRYSVYESNKRRITEHKQLYASGKSSYFLGENKFTDMTPEEFSSQMSGPRFEMPSGPYESTMDTDTLPDSVDWRKDGYVTGVKEQKNCQSCWAFAATGVIEGAHFKATGQLVSLSESNLVDCAQKWGCVGCYGGVKEWAFQYVIDNGGIDTEDSYPYVPQTRPCNFSKENVGATISKYVNVTSGSEDALKHAVATVGPVAASVDSRNFMMYAGGVFDDKTCSSTTLDHAVLVVGYGVLGGTRDFWIVKNSWGTTWGDQGYMLLARNKSNMCGIATLNSYVVV